MVQGLGCRATPLQGTELPLSFVLGAQKSAPDDERSSRVLAFGGSYTQTEGALIIRLGLWGDIVYDYYN